ncbi:MAG: type II toxin-antitoxin system RelE/ParE family toxin [Christensenellales bacterium]
MENKVKYDLLKIKEYISQDSIKNAEKVISEIVSSFENIKMFPNSGNNLSSKIECDNKFKYTIEYSYATIYKIEGDVITILTVMHLKRNFSLLDIFN